MKTTYPDEFKHVLDVKIITELKRKTKRRKEKPTIMRAERKGTLQSERNELAGTDEANRTK